MIPSIDNITRFANVAYRFQSNFDANVAWVPDKIYGVNCFDTRASFSQYGPGVDVFAPGTAIQSVLSSTERFYDAISTPDPRVAKLGITDTVNNNFKKLAGTSMASPQVAGMLACLAEKHPRMTQSDARQYLRNMSPETMVTNRSYMSYSTSLDLQKNPASTKKVAFMHDTRFPPIEVGGMHKKPFPADDEFQRPTSGAIYPRRKSMNNSKNYSFSIATDNNGTIRNGETVNVTITTQGMAHGTLIPYVITSKNSSLAVINTGVSGVYSATDVATGTTLEAKPYTGTSIVTTSLLGSTNNIPNSLLGRSQLTQSSQPTNGSADDGNWELTLPFNINYLGQSYNKIYIGTNSYITFGGGSVEHAVSASNPPLPKILITSGDNKCYRIYYGTEDSSPNRTFRIRYEGYKVWNAPLSAERDVIYEVIFYEATPAKIDVQVGRNDKWASSNIIRPNTLDWFEFTDINVPVTGTVAVSVVDNIGTAILPIVVNTTKTLILNVRLNFFPTPDVDLFLNI